MRTGHPDPTKANVSSATRKKTTTMWLDRNKSGRKRWPKAKTGLLGLLGLLGLMLLASCLMIPRIGDKLTDRAFDRLEAQGIDTDGLDIDFDWREDYRSATIEGELPAGTDVEELERIVADTDGVRNASFVGTVAAADPDPEPEPEPEPTTTTTEEPAPELTPVEATAALAAGAIVLDGTVADDAQRQRLVEAAEEAVGADNVTDNLEVADLDEEVEGSDDRVDEMAGLIAGLGELDEGTATMTDTTLDITGTAPDDDAKAAVEELAAGENFEDGATSIEVAEPEEPILTVAEEVGALQAEIDELSDEIRENVIFDTNSDAITPVAAGTLDKVVAAMNRYKLPSVLVDGHTDDRGTDEDNALLSQQRAIRVTEYMVEEGIDEDRLRGTGYGETQPIAEGTSDSARQQNRRVEFTAVPGF